MPTYRVPTLSSLPGSPASDFDWWSAPPSDLLRYSPDNPNWLGALSLSQGNGANRDMLFRTLRGVLGGQDYLFMQWVVRTSALDTGIDRVNVLLGTPGGNYVAFVAQIDTAASTIAGPQDAGTFIYQVNRCTVAGGVISIVNPGNSSTGDIEGTGRMWIDVTSPTRLIQTKWAFQVAIPLGVNWGVPGTTTQVNLPVSGVFKLWFEVWPSVPMGMSVESYQWPTTAPQTGSALEIIPVGITESQLLDLTTGVSTDAAVELSSWSGIGTRAAPGGVARSDNYTIKLDLGKPYPPNSKPYNISHTPDVTNVEHQNQFYARPTFPADLIGGANPGEIAARLAKREAVRATFSLANWGSQYSNPTASSWRPIPGGSDTLYVDANGECHFVWPTASEPTGPGSFVTKLVQNINKYLNATPGPYPADAQSPHQCMLVELSSIDSSVIITTSSVYSNMNIASASTFRRSAEISVVGALPISAQLRDVYMYVQKFNMPSVAKGKGRGPGIGTLGRDNFNFAVKGGPQFNNVEDIAAFVPTYAVHCYIDTGKKMTLKDGRNVPILRPQTAFGYFVLHEGDLYGWETRLYGAEKLAEDFYVIRVPNNGSAYVETAIQARESANDPSLPSDGVPSSTGWCRRLVAWLETKGILGKILASILALLCRLFGH